ncbi:hypothetical protein ACIRRA_02945 [Nocardia sp. NPDC101769]|uniref:hypothetical protein n=1 Tax=Nocardia sp. NPDC101769 TaxID=3364333 RepID=UPI00382D4DEE
MMHAIGDLVRALSRTGADTDERAMIAEARRLGFAWSATLFEDDTGDRFQAWLAGLIVRQEVDAVFLPSAAHAPATQIEAVSIEYCDVCCMAEQQRHTICTEDGPGPESTPLIVAYRR